MRESYGGEPSNCKGSQMADLQIPETDVGEIMAEIKRQAHLPSNPRVEQNAEVCRYHPSLPSSKLVAEGGTTYNPLAFY